MCLIRLLARQAKEDAAPFFAAIALGGLGEHAKSARRALERRRGDESIMRLAVDWALMEIPK